MQEIRKTNVNMDESRVGISSPSTSIPSDVNPRLERKFQVVGGIVRFVCHK